MLRPLLDVLPRGTVTAIMAHRAGRGLTEPGHPRLLRAHRRILPLIEFKKVADIPPWADTSAGPSPSAQPNRPAPSITSFPTQAVAAARLHGCRAFSPPARHLAGPVRGSHAHLLQPIESSPGPEQTRKSTDQLHDVLGRGCDHSPPSPRPGGAIGVAALYRCSAFPVPIPDGLLGAARRRGGARSRAWVLAGHQGVGAGAGNDR